MSRILVTGATGFIGQLLIGRLVEAGHQVVAITRGQPRPASPGIEWRQADLFSLKDLALAMDGCDQAVYLVHSMLPSSTLSQGSFYDSDLILADNFQRAARAAGLRHVLFMSGLMPTEEKLSWHLRSRLEVEQTLQRAAPLVTVLRAGLVIGQGGSSFVMLRRLVERLPIMLLPRWTQTPTQPIDVRDVVEVMLHTLGDGPKGEVWDIGGPESTTYRELLTEAARLLNLRPAMIPVMAFSLSLSRLWLRLITQAPKSLVYPLVQSLRHTMLVRSEHRYPVAALMKHTWRDALVYWLKAPEGMVHSFAPPATLRGVRHVRSIQRLPLPQGRDAVWVGEEYFRWLPRFFSFLIRVKFVGNTCVFYCLHPRVALLLLEKSSERSTADRQLLYVKGGLLAAQGVGRGRLEFREVLDKQFIMAALHDFRPALPWMVYKYTQAVVHLVVMKSFGKHLQHEDKRA